MNSTFIAILLSFVFASTSTAKYIRGSYFANWAKYRPGDAAYNPELYDPGLCTHLLYAVCTIGDNYTLRSLPEDKDEEEMYGRVLGLKKQQPDLKVLLSFGGWNISQDCSEDNPNGRGETIRKMLESPQHMETFINSVLNSLRKYGFDGFDFNFEPSPPESKEDINMGDYRRFLEEQESIEQNIDAVKYEKFLEEQRETAGLKGDLGIFVVKLKEMFDEKANKSGKVRLILTSAVYASERLVNLFYHVPAFSDAFDFVNVMAYDFCTGPNVKVTDLNSPLHCDESKSSVSSCVSYWVNKGMPKEKIILGFPAYGRGFKLADESDAKIGAPIKGPSDPRPWTRAPGVASYYEILDLLKDGAEVFRDERSNAPYLVKGGEWFTYDDLLSYKTKLEWLVNEGLGGAFVWSLDHDNFQNKPSELNYQLHRTIDETLRETDVKP